MPSPNKGKPFELMLDGSSEFSQAVQSIQLVSQLDSADALEVRFTFSSEALCQMALSDLPKSAQLVCQERGVFAGALASVNRGSHSRLTLTFKDAWSLAHRVFESEYLKEQSLQDCLRTMTGAVGVDLHCAGDFSAKLPGMNITGMSFAEVASRLSFHHGFFLASRSYSNELAAIRLGAFREKVSINTDNNEEIFSVTHESGVEQFYTSGEVRHFHAQTATSQKKEVSQSAIYEPLGFLKSSPSFSERSGWKMARGRMESVESDEGHFGLGEKYLQCSLSKSAAQQETINVSATKVLALPGDRLEIRGKGMRAVSGDFLVAGLRVDVSSSQPRVHLRAVRA